LFTDFDGTLVRIRNLPGDAKLAAPLRELLDAIAHSGATVGIVSGRQLADVRKRVGLTGIWYIGGHGFSLVDPGNRSFALASPRQRKRMRRIGCALARCLHGVAGLGIESKLATLAVHYRGAPSQSTKRARRVIAHLMQSHPEVSLLSGKKVWELFPDARTDKWTAIRFALRRERKDARRDPFRLIFLGDDATDERVFERMKGISIVVGRKHRTAARYYLRHPGEVRRFLEKLKKAIL